LFRLTQVSATEGYVELRCRSAFSFLDGASLPEDLIAAAAAGGADALALTDRDGVYGAPRFFAAARAAHVRPIVGADVTLADGTPPLLLLVEDRTGYRNLCKLLTAARAGLGKHDTPRARR
jgi:error-prone DNA polymerase